MEQKKQTTYAATQKDFITDVKSAFSTLQSEVSNRNEYIQERDSYIFGDQLERALNVPIGHDFTPVNWLRRTVEIHKNMFMSRGFQVVSTYDSTNADNVSDSEEQKRIQIENQKNKEYAEARQNLIKSIIEDNGGDSLWASLAENASAVGDAAVKLYYDEDSDKVEICPIESIENLYALWSKDDFRDVDAYAYVYQVSKQEAIGEYGADENVPTSQLGRPFDLTASNFATDVVTGQQMVTIIEVTGKVEGWAAKDGKLAKVKTGQETELNVLIVGDKITRLITDSKKLPKYYILPNKRQRRRPWGASDISDAAININLTYVETLSDWRTASSKINFNKYKAFGFSQDTQMPKPSPRQVEYIPLADGQDIVELQQTRADGIDWGRQLDECKEQFVRETGISRVLFDDPSVTLNSNQALLTSMKPTSDIAEAKKQLWSPILVELFKDALELAALNKPEIKEITGEDNWTLKVMWPSVMQKEDPVYQSMLLNRFNAGLMSVQSYMEAQGDSKEEIDRIRDEMVDPITSAIIGKQSPLIAQAIINAATAELQSWYASMMPRPEQQGNTPGINANGGGAAQVMPDNQATGGVGMNPVSQPGTGATAATAGGALAQANQNAGA